MSGVPVHPNYACNMLYMHSCVTLHHALTTHANEEMETSKEEVVVVVALTSPPVVYSLKWPVLFSFYTMILFQQIRDKKSKHKKFEDFCSFFSHALQKYSDNVLSDLQ